MKKLMIAALAAATIGGVYATEAPKVFDYKASLKYVDFKTVSYNGGKVYVKVVKSATLKGYYVTAPDCCCTTDDELNGDLLPGFLVVANSAAKKYDACASYAKVLPGNLLAEWWATSDISAKKSATLEAQGYLFAGWMDPLGAQQQPAPDKSPAYNFGDASTAGTKYLFGQFNMPDPAYDFVEPFIYQAGFGKAQWTSKAASKAHPCKPGQEGSYSFCLQSLSGSAIGGSWACIPNGVDIDYEKVWSWTEQWLCQGWDIDIKKYMYNVISGTWSIKRNDKITASAANIAAGLAIVSANDADELALVEACGQKLDKNFELATFDDDGGAETTKVGEFAAKWF